MNGLFLDRFDFERVHFLVENLAHIHNNRFVDFLPQVGAEDLNERNFEGRNFAMHENAGQIELDLETDVNVGAVDGWGPPEGEPPVGDLVQTGPLGIGQLFVLHRLFESRGLFPEQSLPRGEVSALKERVL